MDPAIKNTSGWSPVQLLVDPAPHEVHGGPLDGPDGAVRREIRGLDVAQVGVAKEQRFLGLSKGGLGHSRICRGGVVLPTAHLLL